MPVKLLIYDDHCPLCSWYSGMFIRYGLLPAEGRLPYSSLDPALEKRIDPARGRNEIPLLDTRTGEVLYGIDALLEILGQRFPFIKKTGSLPPVNWLLKRLYNLVTYNRKLIVAKKCGPGQVDCSPDMNYFYRSVFLIGFLLFNTLMLFPIHAHILTRLPGFHLSPAGFQAAHFGLVALNGLAALRMSKPKAVEFLGQVNMLALLAVLLLCPLLLVSAITEAGIWFTGIYLALAGLVIYKEYLRRMEYAGILPGHRWIAGLQLAGMTGFLLFLFR